MKYNGSWIFRTHDSPALAAQQRQSIVEKS
jgi:hypothetical protein